MTLRCNGNHPNFLVTPLVIVLTLHILGDRTNLDLIAREKKLFIGMATRFRTLILNSQFLTVFLGTIFKVMSEL